MVNLDLTELPNPPSHKSLSGISGVKPSGGPAEVSIPNQSFKGIGTAASTPNIRIEPNCNEQALIELQGIVKTFKNAAGEFTALRGITACFYEGEFVSIVGKSGSGKSTLANMITGIDHPTSGSVRVGEAFIHKLNENDMSLWRGRNLGIVFQFFQLMPTLSLLENTLLPMYLLGRGAPSERERRAYELLEQVGLGGFEDKLPAAVSGGQQQCAAIARALANDPPILIADEPTGNLDSRTADEVFAIFAGLVDAGKTILMVTHDASLASRTSRTLFISDGELTDPYAGRGLLQPPSTAAFREEYPVPGKAPGSKQVNKNASAQDASQ